MPGLLKMGGHPPGRPKQPTRPSGTSSWFVEYHDFLGSEYLPFESDCWVPRTITLVLFAFYTMQTGRSGSPLEYEGATPAESRRDDVPAAGSANGGYDVRLRRHEHSRVLHRHDPH